MSEVDPTTLAVVWGGLVSTCEEMGVILRRTAYSEAVREGMDFSPGLFDGKGRLIAQGTFSPGHLGAMPYAVKHAIAAYPPETLKPGDSILLNDSYMGSGHFPDFYVTTPIFYKDTLVGYAVNCVHHVDVGGAGPGSQAIEGVKDLYHEGLRILPVKHMEGGEFNEAVLRIIAANTRAPHKVIGDLKAQRNGNRVGEVRLLELIERYGLEVVNACMEELIQRSEAAVRAGITEIPNGRYTFEDHLDDYGRNTEPIKLKVTVEVKDSDIILDFTGTSPQTESGLNSYINYTRAYSIFAVKSLTAPAIPQNEGGIRPIKMVIPEGSFLNPQPPAAGGARHLTAHRISEVVMGALAQAVPEKALAACSDFANPVIGGLDPSTGRRFVCYDVILGSFGARVVSDGADGLVSFFNPRNIPVEVMETNFPVLMERLEFIQDSAGAGKYRGGMGVRKDIKLLAPQGNFVNNTERHKFAPYGLFGGKPGARGATLLNPGPKEERVNSKESRDLQQGDVLSCRLAGAGGYGDPLERDPEAVLCDVINEVISLERAQADYGVVIDSDSLTLREAETEELRAKLNTKPR